MHHYVWKAINFHAHECLPNLAFLQLYPTILPFCLSSTQLPRCVLVCTHTCKHTHTHVCAHARLWTLCSPCLGHAFLLFIISVSLHLATYSLTETHFSVMLGNKPGPCECRVTRACRASSITKLHPGSVSSSRVFIPFRPSLVIRTFPRELLSH